nr:MAG TPA: hypothetical protein [Caudoviricetes sp.]
MQSKFSRFFILKLLSFGNRNSATLKKIEYVYYNKIIN